MFALMTNIYITNVCEKNCKSCYYPHGNEYMSEDMIDTVATWVGKQCRDENVKEYRAHILGGEPFIAKDRLFSLVDKIRAKLPESTRAPREGQFVVFTNGDELDGKTLAECKTRKIKLMLNPTSDTLLTVHEKMHFIKYVCGGVSLAVVADECNLHRLPALAQLAIAHNGHIRINRLYDGGKDKAYVDEFIKQMHGVFDLLLSAERPMWPNFILESTYPLWYDKLNPYSCGKWLVVIDCDGTIRTCNADISTVCGHVDSNISIRNINFVQRWSSDYIPECAGCEWAQGGWCQGGCPYTRKLAFGTYNCRTPFCEGYKTLFPRLKELVRKWKEYNGYRMG